MQTMSVQLHIPQSHMAFLGNLLDVCEIVSGNNLVTNHNQVNLGKSDLNITFST